MEFGAYRERFERIEADTGHTPTSLEKQPILQLASHQMVFQCFMTLHMMRTSNGFGPNPITLGQIKEYIELFGRPPMDLDLLVRLIKQCDEKALEWIRSKMKTKE